MPRIGSDGDGSLAAENEEAYSNTKYFLLFSKYPGHDTCESSTESRSRRRFFSPFVCTLHTDPTLLSNQLGKGFAFWHFSLFNLKAVNHHHTCISLIAKYIIIALN